MRLNDVGLKFKIIGGGLIPILLAAVLLVLVGSSFASMLESVSWVDRTHRLIVQTSQIQANALGMLAWLRGFIFTGDPRFEKEFRSRQNATTKGLRELKKSLAHNPEALRIVEEADERFEGWAKNVAEHGVRLRGQVTEAKTMGHMAEAVTSEQDAKHFSEFRELIQRYAAKRQALLGKLKQDIPAAATVEDMRKAQSLMEQSQTTLQLALNIDISALEMETTLRGYLLSGDDSFLTRFTSAGQRTQSFLDRLTGLRSGDPTEEKLAKDVAASLASWQKDVADPQIALRKQISSSVHLADVAKEMTTVNTKTSFEAFDAALASFKEIEENLLKEREKAAQQTANFTRTILIAGMAVVVLASLLISYLIARAIARPLSEAVRAAEGISAGDLSRSVESGGNDEVGRLAHAFNQMVGYLREQTARTAEGIGVLASSAAEISATVAELAATSSKTSSAVAETTTTVEQVKQAAKISSEKAKKVAETAQHSVNITETGKRATEDTLIRMNLIKEQMESIGETVVRLSEHSQAIEEIIATVQDLADQSNLLAVNASIEAARAGDQGKGFAVVAHEIKTLADQSKNATEQVRSILQETRKWVSAVVMATEQGGKAVEAGVMQSASTGEAIQSLSNNVVAAFQAASLIQSHTEQQFLGVEQVSTAMASIEEAMKENVSSTSQLEVAARRIEQLGVDLKELVTKFRM